MKPLFVNTYSDFLGAKIEHFKHCFARSASTYVFLFISIACLAVGIYVLPEVRYGISCILIGIADIFLIVYNYFRSIRRIKKVGKELSNGEQIIITTEVYDDRFVIICKGDSEENNSVEYLKINNIKRAFRMKNYIVVRSKSNLDRFFKVNSFSIGSADEFCEFLRVKGIKLRKNKTSVGNNGIIH